MKAPMANSMPLKLDVTIAGYSVEDLLIALEEVWGSVEGNYISGHGGTEGSSFRFEITEELD